MHSRTTMRRLRLLGASAVMLVAASASLFADAAQDCQQQKDTEAQIRACSEYLRQAQGVPEQQLAMAYYFRGDAYISNEQYDPGRRDLDQAIRMNPNLYLAYVSRGFLERFQKQYDGSLQDFKRALAIVEPYSSDPKNTAYISWLKDTVEATGYYKGREERWVEYLKEIQDDRDCQNWSALPYDLYRSTAAKNNKPLPANAEASDFASLQPCDSLEEVRQPSNPQPSDQAPTPRKSSPHHPLLPIVIVGVILIVVLFALLVFSSR